jgi:hypothetical protein
MDAKLLNYIKGVWEGGAKENVWTYVRGSYKGLEKITQSDEQLHTSYFFVIYSYGGKARRMI